MVNIVSRIKAGLLKITCPFFFKKIGKRCTFYGRIRLPLPFRNITIGNDCMIGDSVMFHTGKYSNIMIGDNCSINTGGHLIASEAISIGNNVAIGEYASIRDQEHRFSPEHGVREQGFDVEPVKIADNVWIGRGVYIGPGTNIGRGCIVGANSVVSGVFPDSVLIAGAPAIIKKKLN